MADFHATSTDIGDDNHLSVLILSLISTDLHGPRRVI